MAFNLTSYETVDTRIHKFYDKYENGRILTEIESIDWERGWVLFKAIGYRNLTDEYPSAIGYAIGTQKDRGVDANFWIENAETSSIGRMLANLGLSAKGLRPSAEEMSRVERLSASQINLENPDDPWTVKPTDMPTTVNQDFVQRAQEIVSSKQPEPQSCQHGAMERKNGKKKDGEPWLADMCSTKDKSCTIWYRWSKTEAKWVKQDA